MAGDLFADRTTITLDGSGRYEDTFSNQGFSSSESVPAGPTIYRDAWWEFTPATSGTWIVDTSKSYWQSSSIYSYNRLAVYTGTQPSDLVLVDSNYFGGVSGAAQLAVAFTAGTTYFIRAGMYQYTYTYSPNFTLRLRPQPAAPPSNDNFADATAIPDTGDIPWTSPLVDNALATTEAGESVTYYRSVWWQITPSVTRKYVFDTSANQPSSARIRVGTGTDPASFTQLVYADRGTDEVEAEYWSKTTAVELVGGTTYRVQVYMDSAETTEEVALTSTRLPPAPSNDNWADAEPVVLVDGVYDSGVVDCVSAGMESGEPTTYVKARSVWWSITPAQTGDYYINVAYSGGVEGATAWALYTGGAVNSLTLVTGRYSYQQYLNSKVTLSAGTTYWLQAGAGNNAYQVDPRLLVEQPPPPANDNIADAASISLVDGRSTVVVDVRSATLEVDEPNSGSMVGSAWFTVTPTETGRWVFRVAPTEPFTSTDPRIGVYHGYDGTFASLVVDAFQTFTDQWLLELTGGVTYHVQVGHNNSGTVAPHSVTFDVWRLPQPPANDAVAAASVITELPYQSGPVDLSGAGSDVSGYKDAWWVFTLPASGPVTVNVDDSTGPDLDGVEFRLFQPSGPAPIESSTSDLTPISGPVSMGTTVVGEVQGGILTFVTVRTTDLMADVSVDLFVDAPTAPINDNPTGCVFITFDGNGEYTSPQVDLTTATAQFGGSGEPDVWYALRPDVTGVYSFDTYQSTGGAYPWVNIYRVIGAEYHLEVLPSSALEVFNLEMKSAVLMAGQTYLISMSGHSGGVATGGVLHATAPTESVPSGGANWPGPGWSTAATPAPGADSSGIVAEAQGGWPVSATQYLTYSVEANTDGTSTLVFTVWELPATRGVASPVVVSRTTWTTPSGFAIDDVNDIDQPGALVLRDQISNELMVIDVSATGSVTVLSAPVSDPGSSVSGLGGAFSDGTTILVWDASDTLKVWMKPVSGGSWTAMPELHGMYGPDVYSDRAFRIVSPTEFAVVRVADTDVAVDVWNISGTRTATDQVATCIDGYPSGAYFVTDPVTGDVAVTWQQEASEDGLGPTGVYVAPFDPGTGTLDDPAGMYLHDDGTFTPFPYGVGGFDGNWVVLPSNGFYDSYGST